VLLVVFEAGGLELVEADDDFVELTFDGAHIAEEALEVEVGMVGGEEVARDFEQIGFALAGAGETPEAGGDFAGELEFEFTGGLALGGEAFEELVEGGLVLAGDDGLAGGELVFQRITAGDGFALVGARTAGAECVEIAARDDDVCGLVETGQFHEKFS
jgi:hypothetical protein